MKRGNVTKLGSAGHLGERKRLPLRQRHGMVASATDLQREQLEIAPTVPERVRLYGSLMFAVPKL